jgi:riboflavin synthase
VNLERALRVGDALGGHFVTGHVDVVGEIAERTRTGEWETVWFAFPAGWDELLVPKGSVAIDGVSLTVVGVRPGGLSVMLIPHTLAHTTLGAKPVGGAVNLEFDLLAKHVRKLVRGMVPG